MSTGTIRLARPAKIAATGIRGNIGIATVTTGPAKVKAAGSSRLYTGTATVAAYRVNIAANGTAGVLAHGDVARKTTIAAKGTGGFIAHGDVARKAKITSYGTISTHVSAGDVTLSRPIQIAAVGTAEEYVFQGTAEITRPAAIELTGLAGMIGTGSVEVPIAVDAAGLVGIDVTGTITLDVPATITATGNNGSVVWVPIGYARPQPLALAEHTGHIDLTFRVAIRATGSTNDDELVLALAA